jgi:two-component system, sensor histidine kinase and response regulator
MDIQMPVMDGLEATKLIRNREQENEQHIPIVALTAHASTEDREKGIKAGMDDYLTKPIKIARMMEIVSKLTEG